MENKEHEIRSITASEVRSTTGRIIEGYALKFNVESKNLGGYTEIILPESLTQEFINTQDVICTYNHDDSIVLARYRPNKTSTLQLIVDKVGLFFRFVAPDTQAGNDILTQIKNNNVTSTSFAFAIDREGQRFDTSGNKRIRYITKFKQIADVSIVSNPAYPNDNVSTRSKPSNVKTEQTPEEKTALQKYYLKYDAILNKFIGKK